MVPVQLPFKGFGSRRVCRFARGINAWLARAAVAAVAGVTVSCGGGSPGGPTPPPPPQNQPPVIRTIEVDRTRIEVNQEVALRATVEDAETAPGSLVYEWAADGGAFTGEGASVTWRPPADAATPADFALRLTVIERYGPPNASGAQAEHRVTGTSEPVRVHDSPKELREMSLRFLELFADSDKSPDECLVDFSNSCRGKQSERGDIEDNREYYDIRSASFDFDDLDIANDGMSAQMVVECEFRSRYVKCPPGIPGCVVGGTEEASGLCLLSAIYENNRWWLCDSNFDLVDPATLVPLRSFGGR